MIEETKGIFPTWLSPLQVKVIPVNPEFQGDYAQNVVCELQKEGIRVELDNRNEKLGYRLREAQTSKVPYTLILGDKEKEEGTVSYRLHGEKDTTTMKTEDFVQMLKTEIATKSLRQKSEKE